MKIMCPGGLFLPVLQRKENRPGYDQLVFMASLRINSWLCCIEYCSFHVMCQPGDNFLKYLLM